MPDQDETQPLVPTAASDWGTKTSGVTQILELPSGHVAEIKQTMSILRVVQEGHIPNPLRGVVMQMVTTGSMNMPEKASEDAILMGQFADFLDQIAVETIVDPPVDRPTPRGKLKDRGGRFTNPDETIEEYLERCDKWQPKKGHISVFALDATDKMFLFMAAQGAAANAKQFRQFQRESLEPVEDVKKSPKPTKRTGGSGARKPRK